MFDSLRSRIFDQPQPPAPPAQEAQRRPVPVISAELSVAKDSLQSLRAKVGQAQVELCDQQSQYDLEISAYALGDSTVEPPRHEIAATLQKVDALNRIARELDKSVQKLTAELARAELAETIAKGGEQLHPLLACAEAQLREFQRCVIAARLAEDHLFAILYDERAGLRQRFVGDVNQTQATTTRQQFSREAQATAKENAYRINPRFSVDGEVFLGGEDYAQAFINGRSEAQQRVALQQRLANFQE